MAKESVTRILRAGEAGGSGELALELEKLRRNITVMFTDIKGSTAYFEKYGDASGLMMVHEVNGLQSAIVEKVGGKVIKTIGDAVMASFEEPPAAVQAAINMQVDLEKWNEKRPEDHRVKIRIGINYGLGFVKSNDVFGDVVNVASRVESAASPDQIVISDTMEAQVRDKFKLRHVGQFAFKGKEEVKDVFEVVWNDKIPPKPAKTHTIIAGAAKAAAVPRYKVQWKKDGAVAEQEIGRQGLRIGKTEGDLMFPNDVRVAPQHARIVVEKGQLVVEDVSNGVGDIFVRLVATYPLQDRDTVRMGRQLFQFRANTEAMSNAANQGTTIAELAASMGSIAEFVGVAMGEEDLHFPLNQEEITFGRSKATYVFSDDQFMSRTHSKVYQRGEDFFLEDLGSRNGTFVRVRGKAPVPGGATILVGSQVISVQQV